jgi:hypothetical protein
MAYDEAAILMPTFQQETQDLDNIDLVLDKDFLHEKNLVRLLIEFGHEILPDGKLVCNWIAEELEPFPLDNQDIIQLVMSMIRKLDINSTTGSRKYGISKFK